MALASTKIGDEKAVNRFVALAFKGSRTEEEDKELRNLEIVLDVAAQEQAADQAVRKSEK